MRLGNARPRTTSDDDHPGFVPDYAEPLLAWRLWEIEEVGGRCRLRSLYRHCVWPTGAPLAAECKAARLRLWWRPRHVAPVSSCTCGIYAVRPSFISRLALDGGELPTRSLVLGTVSMWGEVVECERGWRASYAYPERLFVPEIDPGAPATAEELGDYGVPVELLEATTVTAALREVGGLRAA